MLIFSVPYLSQTKIQARLVMKLTDKVAVTEGVAMAGVRYSLVKEMR